MKEILSQVEKYYTEKIKTFGPSPAGVDWNSEQSQFARFIQLAKIISENHRGFSLLDFGCGYGSFYHFLVKYYEDFSYYGFDISEEMIAQARKMTSLKNPFLFTSPDEMAEYDYSVASGIFNVKQTVNNEDWSKYIEETVVKLNAISKKGFSFNMLTSYSDEDKKKDYLYYADPLQMFDFCKKHFSRNISLLHDYELYEFTIIVRK